VFHHHVAIDCDCDASISQKVLHKFEKQFKNFSFFHVMQKSAMYYIVKRVLLIQTQQ